MKMRTVRDVALRGKRVFFRVDGNAPITAGKITDDFRLRAFLPTLDFLITQQPSQIILATHVGRPEPLPDIRHTQDHALSTYPLSVWLRERGYDITVLENLRFSAGECSGNPAFARKLAQLADVYVSDAFGIIHRHDTSIVALPALFDPENRAAGFLLAREVQELELLRTHPEQPFMVVMGGNKIADKLALLEAWCSREQRPSVIMLGRSLCHEQADHFMQVAKQHAIQVLVPEDFIDDGKDIGPKTIRRFMDTLQKARTVFINGTMGVYEEPKTAQGTIAIMQAIARLSAYTVVGGGDAVAAARMANVTDNISFLSTGGGATLAFLSTDNPVKKIPGLQLLSRNQQPGRMFDEGAG